VLVFYRIESDLIFDMSIKDIWTDFVIAKVDCVSCRQVVSFEMPTAELLALVESRDYCTELFKIIKLEYDKGSNVLFVQPIMGIPIDGFLLRELLALSAAQVSTRL
jgi:hypothetical protein